MRSNLSFSFTRATPWCLCVLGALSGCQAVRTMPSADSLLGAITPYKVEVVQGNVITQEQAALVKPGMSRAQVRDILGSSLVADVFHADRWDYVFMLNRPGTPLQKRAVVVIFEGDKLARIDAPALPSDNEFINSIDPYRTRREAPPLALTEEQVKALPAPVRPAPAASAPEGPVRNYPPLDSRG